MVGRVGFESFQVAACVVILVERAPPRLRLMEKWGFLEFYKGSIRRSGRLVVLCRASELKLPGV